MLRGGERVAGADGDRAREGLAADDVACTRRHQPLTLHAPYPRPHQPRALLPGASFTLPMRALVRRNVALRRRRELSRGALLVPWQAVVRPPARAAGMARAGRVAAFGRAASGS